jgi:Fis family transcriptional regulator
MPKRSSTSTSVLDYAEGNQSRAAGILGINRGTLRKKLKQFGLGD